MCTSLVCPVALARSHLLLASLITIPIFPGGAHTGSDVRLGHELVFELIAPTLLSHEVVGITSWRLTLPEDGRRSVQIYSKKERWKLRGSLSIGFLWVRCALCLHCFSRKVISCSFVQLLK